MKHPILIAYHVALAVATLLLASCGNTVTSPVPTGNLSGWAALKDKAEDTPVDFSGIRVSIQGTSYSAVTAADGSWKITGLPQGTYTISFSKEGYFPVTDHTFRFVGHGEDYYPGYKIYQFLQPIPPFAISGITAAVHDSLTVVKHFERRYDSTLRSWDSTLRLDTTNSGKYIDINGTLTAATPPGEQQSVTLIFSTKPAGPMSDSTMQYSMRVDIAEKMNRFSTTFDAKMLNYHGFPSGSRAYITAYPGSNFIFDVDQLTGRFFLTHATPASNEVSVVIP